MEALYKVAMSSFQGVKFKKAARKTANSTSRRNNKDGELPEPPSSEKQQEGKVGLKIQTRDN